MFCNGVCSWWRSYDAHTCRCVLRTKDSVSHHVIILSTINLFKEPLEGGCVSITLVTVPNENIVERATEVVHGL